MASRYSRDRVISGAFSYSSSSARKRLGVADRLGHALPLVGVRLAHHGVRLAPRLGQQIVGVHPRFVAALLAIGHGVGHVLEGLGDRRIEA